MIERTFRAPVAEVWDTIVDPERMNRWIGTWTGEPGAGKRVQFVMTAEGASEPEDVLIHGCDPPGHLDVESFQAGASWRTVDLTETDGVTTLVFRQGVDPADEAASSYGPGWEYYTGSSRCRAGGHGVRSMGRLLPRTAGLLAGAAPAGRLRQATGAQRRTRGSPTHRGHALGEVHHGVLDT